jgi:argininosuccinate lyase
MASNSKKTSNPMWGGHFDKAPDEVMQDINPSIDFDKRLAGEDLAGSFAHVEMLEKQKILTKKEVSEIKKGLTQIEKEINTGKFKFSRELEDIHMNIEARLKVLIGDVAGKLHTARSRNDQVATDFKLFVKKSNSQVTSLIQELALELIKKAEKNLEVFLPGYTHLQAAQPVSFAHHLHCYVEMLGRDLSRFRDANERLDQCPLGAAALAGTSFDTDRNFTAKKLGFKEPTNNSLDSVSDRDFALDFLYNSSVLAGHLSRFAEEIIIWMSEGFKFVKLSDSFTTGSSIMPQKRNPDAAELVRGKTGRINGNLVALLTVMKGLPLAYSKDMQEDKEPVFDSYDTIIIVLKAMIGMVSDMEVNSENMLNATKSGFITATDLADFLVKELKMPFRDAHHVTGRIVKKAEARECDLADLELKDMQEVEPKLTKNIFNVLTVENSVKSRKSHGGTAPSQVKKALASAKKIFK